MLPVRTNGGGIIVTRTGTLATQTASVPVDVNDVLSQPGTPSAIHNNVLIATAPVLSAQQMAASNINPETGITGNANNPPVAYDANSPGLNSYSRYVPPSRNSMMILLVVVAVLVLLFLFSNQGGI